MAMAILDDVRARGDDALVEYTQKFDNVRLSKGSLRVTEGELEAALNRAAQTDGLVFVEIHTGRLDCPEALRSAGRSMAKANQLD